MKIFTPDKIREIDNSTIKRDRITMLDLMERAASAVTFEIVSRWRTSKRIVIFAGPGNNGGDALAVARMLGEQGYHPEVYLFNIKSGSLSECCEANRRRIVEAEESNVVFHEITNKFDPPVLGPNVLVIDGLFGSGLKSPLKGGYGALVQYINESQSFVVSIDVPSGLAGEWNTGVDRRNIVRANLTLAFQFKRLSFFFAENAQFIGECHVLDLDLDEEAINNANTNYYLIEKQDIKDVLRKRDNFTNKYDYGSMLLVAGSYGMMGAAVLAAKGAMRAGAGLVTVHAPLCGMQVMQSSVPEALFDTDKHDIYTTEIGYNHKYSMVAIGPGIGTREETINALDSYMKNRRQPCLLDADALNCIAVRPILLRSIPQGSILTPHAREFDRLFGKHESDELRLKKAIEVARLYNITIVLKGHYTMTVRSDGKVYINSTGNPGMATAGAGDVLTGIITSLVAQGYALDWGVVIGVFVHGLAGDMAAAKHGEYGVMASDIAGNVGRAIHYLMTNN